MPFFEDSDGIVCRRAALDGAAQIVVPVPLRERILRLEPETTFAGHPGESQMYTAMRRYYYWPGMAADVVLHVRNCASSALGRVRPLRAVAALQLFPATPPFQDVATDLFGPLAKTAAGNEYIMVTDRFSQLVRAIPMGKVRAVNCASVLLDYWIGAYGPPDRVLSDGGPQFTAQFWHQECNRLSVEAKVTTPSRTQTNGQAKRFNSTLGRILDHYVAEHPTTWDQLLPALTLAYNTQPHAATKVAPLELVNLLGVASWSIKDQTRTSRYPATAQRGTHAEKKKQAAFLTRLVRLISRVREALAAAQQHCSDSKHHQVGSSSGRSDLLISSVRRRNCPRNRPTAQLSSNGRRGSRPSPGGNRSPKHSWFYQTATGTASPLSINPSTTRTPAAKVAAPNVPNR